MERIDDHRVRIHESEQNFLLTMTGSLVELVVTPEELQRHLDILRSRWQGSPRGDHEIVILYVESLLNDAKELLHRATPLQVRH